MLEQVVRVAPRVTSFTAVCDVCAAASSGGESWLASRVEGRLRLDQRQGRVTCARGHSLRIERAAERRPAFSRT